MSGGFVKLYGSILDSSVWSEDPYTRLVWITMLAMADADGFIEAAVPGLARRANVPLEACESALARLQFPDPYSKSPEHEGRRVARVARGWTILNYMAYRELRTERQVQDAVRQQRHREGLKRDTSRSSRQVSASASLSSVSVGEGSGEREDDRGARLLHESRVAKERRFYAAVARLSELQPEKDPPDIARELTGYTAKAGHKVKGVVRPEGLTDERLDKSLEDAEWWIDDLTKPKEARRGA